MRDLKLSIINKKMRPVRKGSNVDKAIYHYTSNKRKELTANNDTMNKIKEYIEKACENYFDRIEKGDVYWHENVVSATVDLSKGDSVEN